MKNRNFVWAGALMFVAIAVFLVLPFVRCVNDRIPLSSPENGEVVSENLSQRLIDVKPQCQYPYLPTGCESVSAVMVLNFYLDDVDMITFADKWLSKSSDFYDYGGLSYGPDPEIAFAGDPFTNYGYGCYAQVIADAVNIHSDRCSAEVIKGRSLEQLCSQYIDAGVPLLIWATMDMTESKKGASWILPDGREFTWVSGEHCLVLVGYDDSFYYFCDPLNGERVRYRKALCERRYRELCSQAVVIYER